MIVLLLASMIHGVEILTDVQAVHNCADESILEAT
jgi:hypothetical protein